MCNIKVNVDVNKYISPNHIFLDNPKTWPIESTNYLRDNKKIIKKYFSEDKRIEQGKADKNSKNYHKFVVMSNKYQDSFDEIKNNFMELLFDLKYKFVIYHATRLMDYEVDNIRRNGLKLSSKEFIKQKIDDLYRNKIITKNEYDIINEKNLLKSKEQIIKRENQICASIGSQDFRYIEGDISIDPSGYYRLLYNYGGEIIYKDNFIITYYVFDNGSIQYEFEMDNDTDTVPTFSEPTMYKSTKYDLIRFTQSYTVGDTTKTFYIYKINNTVLSEYESDNLESELDTTRVGETDNAILPDGTRAHLMYKMDSDLYIKVYKDGLSESMVVLKGNVFNISGQTGNFYIWFQNESDHKMYKLNYNFNVIITEVN